MSDEQQTQLTSACPHPEAVGKRWGDPISAERQAELQGYLDRWAAERDHGERKGPFEYKSGEDTGVWLSGADAFWLAERVRQPNNDLAEIGPVPDLHLEGASIFQAHLEDADLEEAHLEGADLRYTHLERAHLRKAYLERALLSEAHLESLDGADLREGRKKIRRVARQGQFRFLHGTDLSEAHLEGADFQNAYSKMPTWSV